MAQPLSPLTKFVAEHLDKPPDELAALVAKVFPGTETTGRRYWGALNRARHWLRRHGRPVPDLHPRRNAPNGERKPSVMNPVASKKKTIPKKKTKPKRKLSNGHTNSGSRLPEPEAFDPLETPDAKRLTALVMRVGLNTAEAVIARLKHIEEKQR